jgi:hypothetical protein
LDYRPPGAREFRRSRLSAICKLHAALLESRKSKAEQFPKRGRSRIDPSPRPLGESRAIRCGDGGTSVLFCVAVALARDAVESFIANGALV